jgi:hypothetical protein
MQKSGLFELIKQKKHPIISKAIENALSGKTIEKILQSHYPEAQMMSTGHQGGMQME